MGVEASVERSTAVTLPVFEGATLTVFTVILRRRRQVKGDHGGIDDERRRGATTPALTWWRTPLLLVHASGLVNMPTRPDQWPNLAVTSLARQLLAADVVAIVDLVEGPELVGRAVGEEDVRVRGDR